MNASKLQFSRLLPAVFFGLAMMAGIADARAAELLMFERAGCAYCLRWNAEVAPSYVVSKEARRAPLRRVDLARGQPRDVSLVSPVRFTPTFVLVDQGKEIGRITGYMDNAMFWGLMEKMITVLPAGH